MRRKQLLVFLAAVMAFSAMMFPAHATSPKVADPHKVYVCHATASESNPFVVIHVDLAAESAHMDHGDEFSSPDPIDKDDCDDGGVGGGVIGG